jgi:signal transduction histidine kinase
VTPRRRVREDARTVETADRQIEALELYAEVLARMDEDAPPGAFHTHLCEVVCALTPAERAIAFHYDPDLRRVRPVGAFGIELELFRDAYVTEDTLPLAREALEHDKVVEVDGDAPTALVPDRFAHLVRGRRLACAPIAAGERWLGALLVDRPADGKPLAAEERHLLWTLGKIAGLADTARGATRQVEKARQLQQRIDLAREVHDGVIQRLFGVSLALSGPGPLGAEARLRCADEVQVALADLRSALQRPLGRDARPTTASFADELRRLTDAHADLHLVQAEGDPADVPSDVEALAQSMLAEAVRNARKHAEPTEVLVRTRRVDGAVVVEVENDGVHEARVRGTGMGLRLVAFEALQRGGVLEFGPRGEDRWQVRLVVPLDG